MVKSRQRPGPKKGSSAVEALIAQKIATAPAFALVQVDRTVYYRVEIWCGKLKPEDITAYLNRKVSDGTIGSYEQKPVRHYADNPEASLIYAFDVADTELPKLGIEIGKDGRMKGHIDLG